MIKRYYRSLITLKYAAVQTIAAFLVFIFAFITFRTGNKAAYWAAVASGLLLAGGMVYVQIVKARMIRQLKPVEHLNRYYDDGAVLGRSFFLEERMLLCSDAMRIKERPVSEVKMMKVTPSAKGKYLIQLDEDFITADNRLQAERLAAFLKKKNPAMTLDGIKPNGSGAFRELKAD